MKAVTAPDPITGVVRYWATTGTLGYELCLEFGIDPGGHQVSYTLCNSRPWNLPLWQPQDSLLDFKYGLQSMFDKPLNSDAWVVNVSTEGESYDNWYDNFLPLYKET